MEAEFGKTPLLNLKEKWLFSQLREGSKGEKESPVQGKRSQ
jgi:hypothetical protein